MPSEKANVNQIISTVTALATEGVDVRLIIPYRWRDLAASEYKQQLLNHYDSVGGFELVTIPHVPFAPFLIDKLTHSPVAALYAAIGGCDIVYSRNTLPLLCALAMGKRILFESYRLWRPEMHNAATFLARSSQNIPRIYISAMSDPSRDALIKLGAAPDRVRTIHNGFNPEHFTPRLSKIEARRALHWEASEQIVVLAGRIDMNKGIGAVLDLAEKTPDIWYHLVGFSENKDEEWVLQMADARGIRNIRKFPFVTQRELPTYLYAADVLLIAPSSDPLMKHGNTVMPIKTYGYMAAGRPILASALPDIATVLNKNNACLVDADDTDAANRGIRRILNDEIWASDIAKRAQQDSARYTWQCKARQIIRFLDDAFL